MESLLKTIFLEIVQSLGFTATLLLLIVLIVLILVFKSTTKNIFEMGWTAVFHRKRRNLTKHLTFSKLDYLIKHTFRNVRASCPLRKMIYIDIMTERANVFKRKLLQFVKTDLTQYTNQAFKLKVLSLLDECQEEFIQNCRKNGIPDFILNRMEEKIFAYHEMFYCQVKVFCFADYIDKDNYERMNAILDLFYVAFQFYMGMFEQNLASFNGEIKGLIYKNVSCANCAVCVHDEYLKRLKDEIDGQ